MSFAINNNYFVNVLLQDKCSWDPRFTTQMRKHFEHKGSERFRDMMNKARTDYTKEGKLPKWCPQSTWNQLLAHWGTSSFKEVQEQAKKNRASSKGGVLHTSGRVPHSEIALQAVCIKI